MLLFPRFHFLCKLSIVRWRIEVVDAQVENSVSMVWRSSDRVCHYCIFVLLIEISISCPIHVHKYEYCIHGCIYLLIHDYLYARVGLTLCYIACFSCFLLLRENCEYKHAGKDQWGSTSIVQNKVRFVSLSVICLYFSCILEWIDLWCHSICCGLPQTIGSFSL